MSFEVVLLVTVMPSVAVLGIGCLVAVYRSLTQDRGPR